MHLNPDGDVWKPCCQVWADPYSELWIDRYDEKMADIYCMKHATVHLGYASDLGDSNDEHYYHKK